MNPQGDEDVGDSISYVHDDDSMDVDDVPPQVTFSPPVLREQSPISPSSSATIRPPRLNGHANHHAIPHQSIARLHGTSTRDAEISTLRVERPSSSRNSRSTTRSPTHSPPPASNSGPSRLNPTERLPTSPAGSEGSSVGAFFRTYQSSSVDGRPDGALTPDYVFAEIGHGHGPAPWHGQEQNQNQAYQRVDPATATLTVDDRTQYGAGASYVRGGGAWGASAQGVNVGRGLFGANGVFHGPNGTINHSGVPHQLPTNGASTHGINGISIPPTITHGPPITREERSRGRPRTSREPQAAPTPPAQSQGRGSKRPFRSTLSSVE